MVQNTQDKNSIVTDTVNECVGVGSPNQLACSCNPTGPAAFGKVRQLVRLSLNRVIDTEGRVNIFGRDELKYPNAVFER